MAMVEPQERAQVSASLPKGTLTALLAFVVGGGGTYAATRAGSQPAPTPAPDPAAQQQAILSAVRSEIAVVQVRVDESGKAILARIETMDGRIARLEQSQDRMLPTIPMTAATPRRTR